MKPFASSNPLEDDPAFQPVFTRSYKEIYAGLHIFAARRLIDAGEPHLALKHFRQAARLSPAGVLSVWYKLLQALGGSIGLQKLFLGYRQSRRQLQHRSKRPTVSQAGVIWSDADQFTDNTKQ